ncbi:MAG: chromate efflux transporter [Actinomycetota bacterium]
MNRALTWGTLTRRFLTLGLTAFGGPMAHITQMRRTWVDTDLIAPAEFSDAYAAVSMLPGPASTQMALWIGWRLKGWRGTLVAGALFIFPSVVMVSLIASQMCRGGALSEQFAHAAMGASLAVPGIAIAAAVELMRGHRSSWAKSPHPPRAQRVYVAWLITASAAGLFPRNLNPFFVLLAAGLVMTAIRHRPTRGSLLVVAGSSTHALPSLSVLALKVGALSFGGGFVIVPMMRADVVSHYHWMAGSLFVALVAVGQLTPGPVVATIAGIGYVLGGWSGAGLASLLAFGPSFIFVNVLAPHFQRLRTSPVALAFLEGATPAAIGLIGATAVLVTSSFSHPWQWLCVGALGIGILSRRLPNTVALVVGAALGLIAL